MEEDENQQKEIEQNTREIANKSAQMAKKAINKGQDAAQKTSKLIKILQKSKVLLVVLSFALKALAIALIPTLIIIMLASFWNQLKNSLVQNVSDALRQDEVNNIVTINDDNLQYNIDSDFINRIQQILDTIQCPVPVDAEFIQKLYQAEIMASYPDLRKREKIGTPIKEDEQGSFQGTIKINRKYNNGEQELLEYMKYEDFRTEAAKFGNYDLLDSDGNISTQAQIYNDIETVGKQYSEFKRYFTLDSEYNLIIATISSSETTNSYNDYAKKERRKTVDGKKVDGRKDNDQYNYEYKLTIKKQNYQQSIQKYILPVEFDLIMLMTSQNQGFCEELLELVKDTRITIEVQDNYTTSIVEEKYGYTSEFKFEKVVTYEELDKSTNKWKAKENTAKGTHTEEKDMDDPFSKVTTLTQEISTNILVTDVKSWIGDFSVEYTYSEEEPEPDISSVKKDDDTDFTTIKDYYELHDEFIDSLDDLPKDVGKVKEGSVKIKSKKVEEKQKDKEIVTTMKYKSGTYIKTKVNTLEKEEKFLSLLAVDPSSNPKQFNKSDRNKNTEKIKYKDYEGKEFEPIKNILIFREHMFEMLRMFEKTQSLEETMRYLLYVYNGKNYGVTTLDFSIYEPGNFTNISGDVVNSGSVQEKVWYTLKNYGISDYAVAGAMGNIHYESGGFSPSAIEGGSGNGIGLCQWSFGRRQQLEKYAQSKSVSWKDENTQIEFLVAEITGQGPAASYATQRTRGCIVEEGIISTVYDWQAASSTDDATLYFMRFFESPQKKDSLKERQRKSQEYYELYHNTNYNGSTNHSQHPDVIKYNLNIFRGFIEFKQGNYTKIPPAYQATQEPAGTIKDKGCMPTSICIILSGYGVVDASGIAYTPETLISTGKIQHINGGSSTLANATNTFRKFGLNTSGYNSTKIPSAANNILTNLNKGNAILIHADKGEYTGGGHFMTLIAVNGDQVYLSNPGSKNKSGWRSLKDLIDPKKGNVDWYTVVSK